MDRIVIPNLDVHPSHLCNLKCEQCTHFSDYNINEINSVETIKEWYELWNKKIIPKTVTISGGEPLTNKNIIDILYLTREKWPDSSIRIFTNGLLLKNFPELPKVLESEKISLTLSNHKTTDSKKYDSDFEEAIKILNDWYLRYNIRISIGYYNHTISFKDKHINYFDVIKVIHDESVMDSWLKFYQGYGKEMKPYQDKNKEESWNNCPVYKECFQLHEGKIYKCSPLAYLPLLDKKFGLSKEWDFYLKYEPLSSNSKKEEIVEFFDRKAEKYCEMCPSKKQNIVLKRNPYKIFDIKLIS